MSVAEMQCDVWLAAMQREVQESPQSPKGTRLPKARPLSEKGTTTAPNLGGCAIIGGNCKRRAFVGEAATTTATTVGRA